MVSKLKLTMPNISEVVSEKLKRSHIYENDNIENSQAHKRRRADVGPVQRNEELDQIKGHEIVEEETEPPIQQEDQQEEAEEILVIGKNPEIMSFPHARQDCLQYPFEQENSRSLVDITIYRQKHYCDKCYCYVCDVIVGSCLSWAQHCNANSKNKFWENLRKQKKQEVVLQESDEHEVVEVSLSSSPTQETRILNRKLRFRREDSLHQHNRQQNIKLYHKRIEKAKIEQREDQLKIQSEVEKAQLDDEVSQNIALQKDYYRRVRHIQKSKRRKSCILM